MGCFPCSGEPRTRGEDDRRKKPPAQKSPDISKSPEKLMKEEPRQYGQTPKSESTTKDNSPQRPNSDAKDDSPPGPSSDAKDDSPPGPSSEAGSNSLNSRAREFTLAEMVTATENFKADYFLGEGGFGKVYKGRLQDTNEIVAIKRLDQDGCQGINEFVVEVSTLGNASHPNLVKLIGYCAEGDQRLLVYEYMPLLSLEDHLHGSRESKKLLDWNTRIKVVAGAAEGLEYLHTKMKPPVIYRDLKCSNILLGEGYFPKLSDFGLAKVGPCGDQTHVSTRVMGTYGYCAPDYAMTGQLTFKSDIYSFGVVLLEIVSGRKAIDVRRNGPEQRLVDWAKPLFKDRKKFYRMVDPMLEGKYPMRGLYQVLAISAMCIQEQPNMRPAIHDIVSALKYLVSHKYEPRIPTRVDLPEEGKGEASGNEDERGKRVL